MAEQDPYWELECMALSARDFFPIYGSKLHDCAVRLGEQRTSIIELDEHLRQSIRDIDTHLRRTEHKGGPKKKGEWQVMRSLLIDILIRLGGVKGTDRENQDVAGWSDE